MKKPSSPKERNLVKGALRRVFSRSELRRDALGKTRIQHSDPERPRVTKWSWCTICGIIEPTYLMDIDHTVPLVPSDLALEDMEWNDVIERLWCDIKNLNPVCKDCHKAKSKQENQERRRHKKDRK